MQIILYKYTGESERLNKTLDDSSALVLPEIAFNMEFPTTSPTIKLTSDKDLTAYNYALVDGKYYFVNKVVKYRTNFYFLEMSLDVLMTYRTLILTQTGTVSKSKSALYMQGASIPVYAQTKVKEYDFPNQVFDSNGCYILIGLGYVAE